MFVCVANSLRAAEMDSPNGCEQPHRSAQKPLVCEEQAAWTRLRRRTLTAYTEAAASTDSAPLDAILHTRARPSMLPNPLSPSAFHVASSSLVKESCHVLFSW